MLSALLQVYRHSYLVLFIEGYNLAVLNNIEGIEDFRFVIFFSPASAVFGCYLSCWFTRKYGRIKAFYITNAIYVLGNALVKGI